MPCDDTYNQLSSVDGSSTPEPPPFTDDDDLTLCGPLSLDHVVTHAVPILKNELDMVASS